jgi:hypothetical protein
MPTVQNVQMFKSFKPFASEEMRHRVNVHEYASTHRSWRGSAQTFLSSLWGLSDHQNSKPKITNSGGLIKC